MGLTKQVIFKVGDGEYGIDIMFVSAIEKITNIISVPNSEGYIEGIINLRGEVIPVYSLRNKFQLSSREVDLDTKLIIVKMGNQHLAFKVDAMNEIIEIPTESIIDPPDIVVTEATSYIDKVANIDGRLVILINLNGILTKQEKAAVKEIVMEHQNS